MQRTAIVNLKHDPDAIAKGAVRIDRRTKWGNRFRIGRHGTREEGRLGAPRLSSASPEEEERGAVGKPTRRERREPMAPRYVVRTVDEDWIDLFDAPSRIEEKRAAWDEAKRRVREHPELTTVVLDRRTAATLWQSEPDIVPRYEVVAVDATVFYALETDLPLPGRAIFCSGRLNGCVVAAVIVLILIRETCDWTIRCRARHTRASAARTRSGRCSARLPNDCAR